MDSFPITIIGAGVIGLAVAEKLAGRFPHVLVVEKNTGFGQETSSRNSEVIHAGIYYPARLLKTVFCTEGNRLLYEACISRNIPHRRVGKLIVATSDAEVHDLEGLQERARENGVNDLVLLGKRQVYALEPDIRAEAALFSPSTGIIDTHSLMRCLAVTAEERGAVIAYRSRVTAIHAAPNGYEMEINEGEYRFLTKVLINCAGLQADQIADLAGLDIDKLGYRLKYCKGDYFTVSPSSRVRHLVYPVPIKNNEALGIHATIDLNNRVRFGPDSEYVTELSYAVAAEKRSTFYEAIKRYLPHINPADLQPDMSGIRPKLQGPGEPYRDFVIREERENGRPGFINLIGIESPGMTSCLAIGKHVSALVEQILL